MRFLIALLSLSIAISVGAVAATPPADPTLLQGLQASMANGIDAAVRTWYAERPDLGTEMSAKLGSESARLGSIIDTEIVASQPISKRVTRFYIAVYFTRAPLWIRIDRYQGQDKTFYLPLKCSVNPDEILPGYVTEFYR